MKEKEDILKNLLGEGTLTYIYNTLCKYSHASKVIEFVYLAQKNDEIKAILNNYIIIFLIYPIILVFIDALCTKLDMKEIDNEMILISSFLIFISISILLKDKNKIRQLKDFNQKVLGQPDELFELRIKKEEFEELNKIVESEYLTYFS